VSDQEPRDRPAGDERASTDQPADQPAEGPSRQVVEIVDDAVEADGPPDDERSAITEPGKLMRIALMLREMQQEVREAETDEAGRQRLRVVHERALHQMDSVLSKDLREELASLTLPFGEETPSQSEIRIAQAQLIGWLEGLFQGIQAAIFSQQSHARQQLDQLRPRGIGAGGPEEQSAGRRGTGQYL
jgi:hypothetical protein